MKSAPCRVLKCLLTSLKASWTLPFGQINQNESCLESHIRSMFSKANKASNKKTPSLLCGADEAEFWYRFALPVQDTTCLESSQVTIKIRKSVSAFWSKTYCSLSESSVSVTGHNSTHKVMTHNRHLKATNMDQKKTLF